MDGEKLTECIRRYGSTVKRASYSLLRNTADCEDITQETFTKLYLYEGTFESEEHIKAWLIRAAINLAKDQLKSPQSKNRAELTDSPAPESEELSELHEALGRLESKYRVTVYLHYYEGYSAKETAALLKISEAAVKTRLKRARQKLKAFLTETL